VLADEACVCDDCVQQAMEAQIVDEFPHGEFDDGRHWRRPAQALSPLSPGQWASEPCGDPEWTEEALDAAVAHMDEVEERAWLEAERAAERVVQQFIDQYSACFDPVPVGRCRCGGLVVTQPGSTRVVCVECGADYPESPGWE
jgi:hypothetical protein